MKNVKSPGGDFLTHTVEFSVHCLREYQLERGGRCCEKWDCGDDPALGSGWVSFQKLSS